jgi:hypothetical protein
MVQGGLLSVAAGEMILNHGLSSGSWERLQKLGVVNKLQKVG